MNERTMKEKLQELQNALDILAKKQEKKNAKKAETESHKTSKQVTHPDKKKT